MKNLLSLALVVLSCVSCVSYPAPLGQSPQDKRLEELESRLENMEKLSLDLVEIVRVCLRTSTNNKNELDRLEKALIQHAEATSQAYKHLLEELAKTQGKRFL